MPDGWRFFICLPTWWSIPSRKTGPTDPMGRPLVESLPGAGPIATDQLGLRAATR